jgi:hypothetical protein
VVGIQEILLSAEKPKLSAALPSTVPVCQISVADALFEGIHAQLFYWMRVLLF